MKRVGLQWVIVGVVVVGAVSAARAEPTSPLTRAHTAVDDLDYGVAKIALADALAAGNATPAELADIYRLTGIVDGALGEADGATIAFEHWLALVPRATLPAGTSPKITRPFAVASTYFETHEPLHVKTETSADEPSLTLVVTSDPLAMIAGARVMVAADGGAEQTLEARGTDKLKVVLPRGRRLDVRVAAIDSQGNHVIELGTADVPIVITGAIGKPIVTGPPAPPQPRPVEQRPLWKAWWLWGGVSVAVLGAGSLLGYEALQARNELEVLDAHSQLHSFDEAKTIESRGKRDALLANIGWGAGGAVAALAVILYLTRPAPSEHQLTTITPAPVQGGGAIVLGGSF